MTELPLCPHCNQPGEPLSALQVVLCHTSGCPQSAWSVALGEVAERKAEEALLDDFTREQTGQMNPRLDSAE